MMAVQRGLTAPLMTHAAILFIVKPALTATDARCEAAQGLADFTKSSMDYEISQLELYAGVVQLVNGLVSLIYAAFPEVAWFNLVFDFCSGLAAAGAVALNTAFTSAVYADLACIFYLHMDGSGQISPSDMTDILTAIDSTFGVNLARQYHYAGMVCKFGACGRVQFSGSPCHSG